jgi:hypothetical protein
VRFKGYGDFRAPLVLLVVTAADFARSNPPFDHERTLRRPAAPCNQFGAAISNRTVSPVEADLSGPACDLPECGSEAPAVAVASAG